MKIFILKPKCPEAFLEIKSIYFSERRRERVRKYVAKINKPAIVWFEDEEPPNHLIETIEEAHRKASNDPRNNGH